MLKLIKNSYTKCDNVIKLKDFQHTFLNDFKRGFKQGFSSDIKLLDLCKIIVCKK